jgi:hypothetical protein
VIDALFEGPLDIVGDVHGELDALRALLQLLGYAPDGRHREGRRLVFVGDLVDRGPDSPGVVERVRGLVEAGRAQVILGNHELNLLRGQHKHGNEWFWADGWDTSRATDAADGVDDGAGERRRMLAWFGQLPLALQRADLRIVHAAWDAPSIARVASAEGRAAELFMRWDDEARRRFDAEGLAARAAAQKAAYRHHYADPDYPMPMLDAVGQLDEARQTLNPVRVLTSGLERCADAPFFTSGQWRFARRLPWWERYRDEVAVVVGHFWRRWQPLDRAALGKGDPDLFDGTTPTEWLGRHGRVFCVDFSVGGRSRQRQHGGIDRTRLGALRWPERELVLDHGERVATVGFGASRA